MEKDKALLEIVDILDNKLSRTGDYRKSQKLYQQIRDIANEASYPDFVSLVYMYEQTRMCNYDDAIRRGEKALQWATNALFYINLMLAYVYLFKDDLQRSRSYVDAAKQIDPNHFRIPIMLGGIEYMEENYDEAIDYYRLVMESHPDHPTSYLGIGNVHLVQENYNKALGYFEVAFYYAEDIPQIHCGFAQLAIRKNDFRLAEKHVRRALELDDYSLYVNGIASMYYYETGQITRALGFAQRNVELSPDDKSANGNVAFYLMITAKFAEALEYANRAKELGSSGADELIEAIEEAMNAKDGKVRFKDTALRPPTKE